MLKLGHITYSNCIPVHAGILTHKAPFPFLLVEGIPTELNAYLLGGTVDVSPSSSIEYALNADRYLIMPGLSITSRTRAMSIVLESRFSIQDLNRKTVALTKASATSNVLLRVLLELRYGVGADYLLYAQGAEDPYAGADAVLTIGDLALKRSAAPRFPHVYDLGDLWHRFTGLPFVFALWQVNYKKNIDNDLMVLYDVLTESKKYGLSHLRELADAHAAGFGLSPEALYEYWNSLCYDLGEEEHKGLLTYYGFAAELGLIDSVPELRFVKTGKKR
jgi:chorismate dehydratase